MVKLNLEILPETYAICRLLPTEAIPNWATKDVYYSITKTPDELSIVCAEENVPQNIKADRGWRCLKVRGPLAFNLTGIMASLAVPLAQADISLFALSTYDTDYLLLKSDHLTKAKWVLSAAGHCLMESPTAE